MASDTMNTHNKRVEAVMRGLARAITGLDLPAVEKIANDQQDDPFRVLIATLLSARTQDATTLAASTRLFKVARTPATMARLPVTRIERLIYPVSFYRTKAKHVKATCKLLVERFGVHVPSTMKELLQLPGVGRKTANLVLILSYRSLENICVDTHVHRISNRFGYVRTKTPDETEMALRASLPRRYWIGYNDLLVTFGQNVCTPVSPKCSLCPVRPLCRRVGVTSAR